MAAVTLLGSATFNTNSGTKTVTATPALNDLIVIILAHSGNVLAPLPTDNNSDGLGTYTEITNCVKNSSADTMRVFIRNALVGNASSTVFTHAPGTTTGGGLAVIKVTGMTRVGYSAFRQFAVQSNQSAATPAPVFGQAVLTGNPVIGAVFNASNPAALTPRTSFAELFDNGYATPTTGLEIMSRDSGETGTTMTWGGASASAFCSVAVELNTDATATSIVISENTIRTYAGNEDAEIRQNNATINYGTGTTFNVTAWDTGDTKHTLIKFGGLSNVSAGNVTNGRLRLYLTSKPGNNPTTQVYALRRNFVEGQATFNEYSSGNNWGTAGALNTSTDYNNTLLAANLVGTTGRYYEFGGDAITAYIQAIVNGGTDYGLLLIDSADSAPAALNREANYISSEGTDGQRPILAFDWSSAGTNLVIADATSGHSTDGIGLTSEHLLSISDAAHAHSTDAVVLTSQTAVVVAEAGHAHSADNLSLSVGVAMAVNDAAQDHTTDGITLTLENYLSVNDSAHADLADNIVLSSALSITVADAQHGHLSDNLALSSALAIVIAEALHTHAADNVTLGSTGSINLLVDETLHAHSIDNVILTSQLSLIVAEALHAQFGDEITLSTQSALLVSDAEHGHLSDSLILDYTSTIALNIADSAHAQFADNLLLSIIGTIQSQYPLAGIRQTRPLEGVREQYPLEGKERQYP
jgi:hypothetical protein